ncbi:MAG: hypothetical protein ACOCUR_01125 [Nanoarchaeota archaeon]
MSLYLFTEYARLIWENDSYVAADRLRWHSSGYHIRSDSLSIDDAVEDAHEALDIIPENCNIPVSIMDWQEYFIDNPRMISTMASTIYSELKQFDRYSFREEPDWDDAAKKYIDDYL